MSTKCHQCGGDDQTCNLCVAYNQTVAAITDGTVANAHFSVLFEALGKSTNERVHRRKRISVGTGTGRSMAGAVVPKRVGDNNPIKGRGKKYASGTPAKKRQNAKQAAHKASGIAESKIGVDEEQVRKVAEGLKRDVDGVHGVMPGYGNVYLNDKNDLYYVSGDSDGRDFQERMERAFKKIKGIKSIKMEAETSPKEGEGWRLVYDGNPQPPKVTTESVVRYGKMLMFETCDQDPDS
jgi:hypothetical protein